MTNSSNEAMLQKQVQDLQRQLEHSREVQRRLENELSDVKMQRDHFRQYFEENNR